MRRLLFRALLVSAVSCGVHASCGGKTAPDLRATPPPSSSGRPGWHLVWRDEFDTAIGPDWSFDIGTGANGWGNREPQFYTARPENVRVERGVLVIEARKEPYSSSGYTSARLKTEGRATFTFGRIEARVQVPRGQGLWPAFTRTDVPGAWVFDHPFFLLLNLAVGGNWPGSPSADTAFPALMKVDYVRVYARPS